MDHAPLSILLADDNPANQKVLGYMLKRLGHDVTIVGTGREAVHVFAEKPFDLVFMDMMMPEMDGLEATRVIRQQEAGKRHTPIIAVTANVERTDERQCVDAGMDAFLTKPFTLPEIRERVDFFSRSRFESSDSAPVESGLDSSRLDTFMRTMGDGDMAFTLEILDDLLTEGNRSRSAIQHGLEQQSASDVRQAAHSLKSAAAVVGARELAALCGRVESAAKGGRLDDVQLLLGRFEGALNDVRTDVEAFRKRHLPDVNAG